MRLNRVKMAFGLLVAVVVLTTAVGVGWYILDRTTMVETVCKAGLPNLSRPGIVPADQLGCAVLGPKRRIVGLVETSFENSTLIVGRKPEYDDHGLLNEAAWFSGTPGVADRGGDALSAQLAAPRNGLCGRRMAAVVVDGWMTVSRGGFGHLNASPREFYAQRVVSASPPPAEVLEAERRVLAESSMPPGVCEWIEAHQR